MPDIPSVLTPTVEWACWDCLDNLLVARRGRIERWRPSDFELGKPSFTFDTAGLNPPSGESQTTPVS
ncbi:MAG: hypothetical protein AB8F26_10730 [Phycisphaerales bacterium]